MTSRRDLLRTMAFPVCARGAGGAWRGVFPILQADSAGVAMEIEFVQRCGAHGVVWPQRDLEWSDGAEAVMAAARGPAILCVQGHNLESTRRRARLAGRLTPAAVMAAPLNDLNELAGHYRAIAAECSRPLVAHTAGAISVEFVLRLRDEIPTLRMVFDEAGHSLSRISEYRRVAPDLAVFTSGRGRALPDELDRGASGVMPSARFAKSYVRIWSDCLAGRRESAIAGLSRLSSLSNLA